MITPNCKSETKIDIHAYLEQNYLRSRNSKTRNHFTGDGDGDGDNMIVIINATTGTLNTCATEKISLSDPIILISTKRKKYSTEKYVVSTV